MEKIAIYKINAFTNRLFGGNPAAVCYLERWLPSDLMQKIAAENALPETAFIVPSINEDEYAIKWFTPDIEMDLCGHATLASAHVLFHYYAKLKDQITFTSNSVYLKFSGMMAG